MIKLFACRGNKYDDGEYRKLRHDLFLHEVSIPECPHGREINRFNLMVFSAKAGEGVMTGLKTLLEVANYAYEHGKQFMWYFGRVLKQYDKWEKLIKQDQEAERKKRFSGKQHTSWTEKATAIKLGYKEGGEFKPERSYDKLFFFLFPEIAQRRN